jgi:ABC-type glycerol-3-phosphate transport system substrate-binding protein
MLDNGPDKNLAAFIFMNWVMETEQTAEWAIRSGYLPVRDSARNLPLYRDFLESNVNPTKVTGASYLPTDYIFDAIFPESFSVRQAVQAAVLQVILGELTAAEALQDAYNNLR